MTKPLPIPASAIEAAAREIHLRTNVEEERIPHEECLYCRGYAEAALRAAFDELGMEREEQIAPIDRGGDGHSYYRLVSHWMPVEKS